MSSLDVADIGTFRGREQPDDVENLWRDRIQQSRNARRALEPSWMQSLAFAAGKHWLQWHEPTRSLKLPPDLADKELYTADVISEYRMTALGDLATEDDRPELLLIQDAGEWLEEYQKALNRALGHTWEHEAQADRVLGRVDRFTIDLGTSAVRCCWDPNAGGARMANGEPVQAPYVNGSPMLDAEQARAHVASMASDGRQADIRTLSKGRICWEPLSAFNLLPPPGVDDEADFPWEIIVQPTPLDEVQGRWGKAASLTEDSDIGTVLGTDYGQGDFGASSDGQRPSTERLRGHVWLFTCYQRPTKARPKGLVVTLAGTDKKLLEIKSELPYTAPDGSLRTGISYFHWQRVTGRFWSRSLVEALKDPQRAINRRRTQATEIIDRDMPFVLVQENSIVNKRHGTPFEKVEIKEGSAAPVQYQGHGPGQWMQADVEASREDLEHASGFKGVRLGENPAGVSTYSQLALLNENDRVKRLTIGEGRALSIKQLVEDTVDDMRRYWGQDRAIMFQTDGESKVQGAVFDATKIPPFFIVRIPTGATMPRGQAAQLKIVEDIFTAGINSQQPLPLSWLKESYEAGQPIELPVDPGNEQRDKAQLENQMMMATGIPLHVAYYDSLPIHLSEHRSAQIHAEIAGDMKTWEAIEAHVQQHIVAAAQNAARVASEGPMTPAEAIGGQAPAGAPAGAQGPPGLGTAPVPPQGPGGPTPPAPTGAPQGV